jgi:hypothetical protein
MSRAYRHAGQMVTKNHIGCSPTLLVFFGISNATPTCVFFLLAATTEHQATNPLTCPCLFTGAAEQV